MATPSNQINEPLGGSDPLQSFRNESKREYKWFNYVRKSELTKLIK